MIQLLCEHLAGVIRAADLVAVAGGMATVWKSNTLELRTKAAYWNYATLQHETLVPDADRAAITYFEERGSTRITNGPAGKYEADLNLIGWVNTGKGVDTVLLIEQLQALFSRPLTIGQFSGIRVDFKELLPENEQLFSRYNYDTAVRKYLQKPYDAFGLRMLVTFSVC